MSGGQAVKTSICRSTGLESIFEDPRPVESTREQQECRVELHGGDVADVVEVQVVRRSEVDIDGDLQTTSVHVITPNPLIHTKSSLGKHNA